MMRTTQEIFDVVIDEGFYGRDEYGFMCNALKRAYTVGSITPTECTDALIDIAKYLNAYPTLESLLVKSELPCAFPDRLAIYRNWANRPQLKGTNHE